MHPSWCHPLVGEIYDKGADTPTPRSPAKEVRANTSSESVFHVQLARHIKKSAALGSGEESKHERIEPQEGST
eukprot:7316535-Pyramimonas_sp.AAC.1